MERFLLEDYRGHLAFIVRPTLPLTDKSKIFPLPICVLAAAHAVYSMDKNTWVKNMSMSRKERLHYSLEQYLKDKGVVFSEILEAVAVYRDPESRIRVIQGYRHTVSGFSCGV
jgi:hypothetical protein